MISQITSNIGNERNIFPPRARVVKGKGRPKKMGSIVALRKNASLGNIPILTVRTRRGSFAPASLRISLKPCKHVVFLSQETQSFREPYGRWRESSSTPSSLESTLHMRQRLKGLKVPAQLGVKDTLSRATEMIATERRSAERPSGMCLLSPITRRSQSLLELRTPRLRRRALWT